MTPQEEKLPAATFQLLVHECVRPGQYLGWDDGQHLVLFVGFASPFGEVFLPPEQAPEPSSQAFRDQVSEAEQGCPVRLAPGLWGPIQLFSLEATKVRGRWALPSPPAETLDVVILCEVGLLEPLGIFKAVPSAPIETSFGELRSQGSITAGPDAPEGDRRASLAAKFDSSEAPVWGSP